MARIRQLKPTFFSDEDVAELSPWARLLFMGIWGLADRDGRLEERQQFIRVQVFPYDDLETLGVTMAGLLDELARPRRHSPGAFVTRYESGGRRFIQVNAFAKHQKCHPDETVSKIPAPPPLKAATPEAGIKSGSQESIPVSKPLTTYLSGEPEPVLEPELTPSREDGTREQLKAARLDLRRELDEAVTVLSQPFDVLLAKYSRTPSNATITNIAGCSRLKWLEATASRVRGARLAAQGDAMDGPPSRAAPNPRALEAENVANAMMRGGMSGRRGVEPGTSGTARQLPGPRDDRGDGGGPGGGLPA